MEERVRAGMGNETARALESLDQVTIGLNGLTIGGAVVFASCMDIRLAAESAWFSIPEVDLDIPLTWNALPKLMRELGPARTKELVMTCDRFSSREALQYGFVNHVVPDVRTDAAGAGTGREAVEEGRDLHRPHQVCLQRPGATHGAGAGDPHGPRTAALQPPRSPGRPVNRLCFRPARLGKNAGAFDLPIMGESHCRAVCAGGDEAEAILAGRPGDRCPGFRHSDRSASSPGHRSMLRRLHCSRPLPAIALRADRGPADRSFRR